MTTTRTYDVTLRVNVADYLLDPSEWEWSRLFQDAGWEGKAAYVSHSPSLSPLPELKVGQEFESFNELRPYFDTHHFAVKDADGDIMGSYHLEDATFPVTIVFEAAK